MKTPLSLVSFALVAVIFFPTEGRSQSGIDTDRTFNLAEGWNAIYIDFKPDGTTPEEVFNDDAIQKVSAHFPRVSSAQFTSATFSEGSTGADFGKEGWLHWRNPKNTKNPRFGTAAETVAHYQASNTLQKIPFAHQAFLVQATRATSLKVTGKVRFHRINWSPDAFNFVGFQLDPTTPITFRSFFAGSAAHADELVYKLQSDKWKQVQPGEIIQPGTGYWVFCRGGSDHQGPLDIKFPGGDRLNFGKATQQINIDFRNTSDSAKGIEVSQNTGLTLRYAVQSLDPGRTFWLDLASPATIPPIEADSASLFRLLIDRQALSGTAENTVTVSSGGMRFRIPAFAEELTPGAQINGLWIGNVTITRVNQISNQGSDAGGAPTPAGGQFNMRIILHAGSGGVKLLEEVSIMRNKTPGPDGKFERVLITRDDLIPDYGGIVRRSGKLVGQRISSPFYHFEGTELNLSGGGISLGGTVKGTIVLPADHPANPFRHQFNPDHAKGREITRVFEVAFTGGEGVESTDKPTQGQRLSGTYKETIIGLVHPNKGDIKLEGTIDLQLASEIATLNGQ